MNFPLNFAKKLLQFVPKRIIIEEKSSEDNFMPLVTTTEMFKKAYAGGYAVGAFNVNNMEMIQAIVEAANECRSPVILQVSAGAR